MARHKYYQRPDGLFETSRTLPNGKRKMFRGKTCKEVDAKILAYQEEKDLGKPFDEIAGEWWGVFSRGAKEATYTAYKTRYNRAVEHFGKTRTGKIRTMDLQRFLSDMAKEGYSYSAVNAQKIVLNHIYEYAVESGYIESNPCREVKLPKDLPAGTRPPLTAEQEKKAKEYKFGEAGLMAQMLLYTGMRIGELMALTWEDIDTEKGVIHITKKIGYCGNCAGRAEDFLKSKNGKRDVPILAPLRPFLRHKGEGLIFQQDNGKHWSQGRYRKAWRLFCADTRMLDKDGKPEITPHQLRHTFATICYEAGEGVVDAKTCARWMGDSQVVVEAIYQSLRPEHEQTSAERLNEYLEQLG